MVLADYDRGGDHDLLGLGEGGGYDLLRQEGLDRIILYDLFSLKRDAHAGQKAYWDAGQIMA